MPEKRMLIVPAELVEKINENRGDMSQSEFIEFLIDSQLKQDSKERSVTKEALQEFEQGIKERYVTKEALQEFEQGIKDLLRSFLEFFVSYGLELGGQPTKGKVEELSQKLQGLGGPFAD